MRLETEYPSWRRFYERRKSELYWTSNGTGLKSKGFEALDRRGQTSVSSTYESRGVTIHASPETYFLNYGRKKCELPYGTHFLEQGAANTINFALTAQT